MPKPEPLDEEVLAVAEAGETGSRNPGNHRKTENRMRRAQALALRLSGVTYEAIGDHLGISTSAASTLVNSTLDKTQNRQVGELRDLENARLDKAQAAIWSRVIQGDDKAISTYLKISSQRARINGLNAPMKVEMNVAVKYEMEKALSDLESLVLVQEQQGLTRADQEDIQDAEVIDEKDVPASPTDPDEEW